MSTLSSCKAFKVARNESVGRFLVSTRKIRSGETVLIDPPMLLAPQSLPVCLVCLSELVGQKTTTHNSQSWPKFSQYQIQQQRSRFIHRVVVVFLVYLISEENSASEEGRQTCLPTQYDMRVNKPQKPLTIQYWKGPKRPKSLTVTLCWLTSHYIRCIQCKSIQQPFFAALIHKGRKCA